MKRLMLISLAACVLLGGAALLSRGRAPEAVETMGAAPAATPRAAGFLLAEYGGRVAVYGAEAEAAPREITSIWVHYLPTADRNALKKGISAADELDLAALLEDLGS